VARLAHLPLSARALVDSGGKPLAWCPPESTHRPDRDGARRSSWSSAARTWLGARRRSRSSTGTARHARHFYRRASARCSATARTPIPRVARLLQWLSTRGPQRISGALAAGFITGKARRAGRPVLLRPRSYRCCAPTPATSGCRRAASRCRREGLVTRWIAAVPTSASGARRRSAAPERAPAAEKGGRAHVAPRPEDAAPSVIAMSRLLRESSRIGPRTAELLEPSTRGYRILNGNLVARSFPHGARALPLNRAAVDLAGWRAASPRSREPGGVEKSIFRPERKRNPGARDDCSATDVRQTW